MLGRFPCESISALYIPSTRILNIQSPELNGTLGLSVKHLRICLNVQLTQLRLSFCTQNTVVIDCCSVHKLIDDIFPQFVVHANTCTAPTPRLLPLFFPRHANAGCVRAGLQASCYIFASSSRFQKIGSYVGNNPSFGRSCR